MEARLTPAGYFLRKIFTPPGLPARRRSYVAGGPGPACPVKYIVHFTGGGVKLVVPACPGSG